MTSRFGKGLKKIFKKLRKRLIFSGLENAGKSKQNSQRKL